jgi:hypothetical protein
MTGKLHRAEYGEWLVQYQGQEFQLHPDDVEYLLELDRVFDCLESRIAASPEVKFEIVEHQKLDGVATYAKLITR